MKQYNKTFSLVKGIGIILMVLGHVIVSGDFHKFIYLFHMPLFFFVSGYFFKQTYLNEKLSFCKHRFRSLYLPFVKWGLVFLLLHNLFFYCHFYSSAYDQNDPVSHLYSMHEFAIYGFKVIMFSHIEQLLGTYWFLQSLLCSCLFYVFAMYLITKRISYPVSAAIVLMAFLLLSIILAHEKVMNLFRPATFIGVAFFAAGNLYHIYEHKISVGFIGLVLSFIVMLVAIRTMPLISMLSLHLNICLIPLYFVIACFGIYMTICASHFLTKVGLLTNVIDYIGNRTIYVMTFHFLAFKAVSYAYVGINGLPVDKVSLFPVIPFSAADWPLFVFYPLAGICFPLIIEKLISTAVSMSMVYNQKFKQMILY